VWYHGRCGALSSSWAFSSRVDEFHAVLFLEKKRTNSDPFMESTSKHSIYTLAAVVQKISRRVIRTLRRLGYLEAGTEDVVPTGHDPLRDDAPELAQTLAASVQQRLAFGERAGQRVRRIGAGFGHTDETPTLMGPRCASVQGFSLHANTQVLAHRRDQLERLIRYAARGALSLERLTQDANGDLVYTFTHPWSDGTTGIRLSPLELLEKLAALVPLPRMHLVCYGGCLAPHSAAPPALQALSASPKPPLRGTSTRPCPRRRPSTGLQRCKRFCICIRQLLYQSLQRAGQPVPQPAGPVAGASWPRRLPARRVGRRESGFIFPIHAEAVAHHGSLMQASWGIGLLSLRQGALRRALPLLERAVGICHEADLPAYFPGIAAALGAAYTVAGRVADAVPLLTQAIEQTIATDMAGFQGLCSLSLGEVQVLAGRLEEAHALAERTLALARERQERGNEAYSLRLLGEITVRREPSEVEQAEAHYQQALALAEELGMRPLQAHCHLGLGTLYATTGQQEQARAALSTAIALYRAMDMTFWLPQAEAALAQVSASG
jgi:tetratricopeptide (TPR) repeat protein